MEQPMFIKTGGGGGSHIGSIVLGLIVLLIIGAIAYAIYAISKSKQGKSDKWSKSGKSKKWGKGEKSKKWGGQKSGK